MSTTKAQTVAPLTGTAALAYDYLKDTGGHADAFRTILTREVPRGHKRWPHRVGQVFFNTLNTEDAARIVGTPADPFHSDSWDRVEQALDFLTKSR